MKIRDLKIDEDNEWKLAGRASKEEVFEVAYATRNPTWHDGDEVELDRPRRCRLIGATREGRVLRVITEPMGGGIHRFVAVWPASEKEIRRYVAWKRTVRK